MTVWKTDKTWTYESFSIGDDSDLLAPFSSMIDLWRSKRTTIASSWADFDLADLQPYWGWINVFDVCADDRKSFDVRLFGSKVAGICGYDVTGQRLEPGNRPKVPDFVNLTPEDLRYYRYLLDEDFIGVSYGPFKIEFGELINYSILHLPLSRSRKENDQIMLVARVVG